MNHMELQYFKTDKNGTKYYYDWKCPRCAGYGQAEKWMFTGLTCFECGGTGMRRTAKVVKEYTPEYWEKLAARRKAKAERETAERAQYEAEHANEIAEQIRETIVKRYAENGCGEDGVGYVLTGNTFKIKDEIKKVGGKWIYGCWVCPVEIKCIGITAKRIDLNGHIGGGSMYWLDDFDLYEAIKG